MAIDRCLFGVARDVPLLVVRRTIARSFTADTLRVTRGLSSVYNTTTVGANTGSTGRHDLKAGVFNTTGERESFFAFTVGIWFYYKGRAVVIVPAGFLTKVLASGTTLVQEGDSVTITGYDGQGTSGSRNGSPGSRGQDLAAQGTPGTPRDSKETKVLYKTGTSAIR